MFFRTKFALVPSSVKPFLSFTPKLLQKSTSGMSKTTTGIEFESKSPVLDDVKEYYGKVLENTKDLKTCACTASGAPPPHVRDALKKVPESVLRKFYGCGNPIPFPIEGLKVLDLGCGSGRDVFVASLFAGKNGHVYGIDMTDEQLDVAKAAAAPFATANPDAAPTTFLKGFIEDLTGAGVKPNSIDLIISNCVVNLSPNKRAVLESAYASLVDGGEFYFSDVYCDRRLPDEVRQHKVLFGECLGGALYTNDFVSLAKSVGFNDPRKLSSAPIEVYDNELTQILGNAKFYSITYRLFKLPKGRLEDNCEDYGQVARYLGGMKDTPFSYKLDDHHVFDKSRAALVCGNTASMLEETWLRKFFKVDGNRNEHFGAFDCSGGGGATTTTTTTAAAASAGGGGCGASGSCSGGDCSSGGCCG